MFLQGVKSAKLCLVYLLRLKVLVVTPQTYILTNILCKLQKNSELKKDKRRIDFIIKFNKRQHSCTPLAQKNKIFYNKKYIKVNGGKKFYD